MSCTSWPTARSWKSMGISPARVTIVLWTVRSPWRRWEVPALHSRWHRWSAGLCLVPRDRDPYDTSVPRRRAHRPGTKHGRRSGPPAHRADPSSLRAYAVGPTVGQSLRPAQESHLVTVLPGTQVSTAQSLARVSHQGKPDERWIRLWPIRIGGPPNRDPGAVRTAMLPP